MYNIEVSKMANIRMYLCMQLYKVVSTYVYIVNVYSYILSFVM